MRPPKHADPNLLALAAEVWNRVAFVDYMIKTAPDGGN
jgi:hypothetical protein